MDLDTRGGPASTLSLVVEGGEGQEGDSEVQGEEVMEGAEGEDMGEVGSSLVLKCLRRAANKFPNKLQFRWNLMIYCFKESG